MLKGASAEVGVGQAVEYALTSEGCAGAHHVEKIAKVGDIDHLVATPRGLWVIETKHGFVPKSEFRETLRRIASNVEGVREWAPGTRVTGCLVFGSKQEKPHGSIFSSGKVKIMAFEDPSSLMKELRRDAGGKGGTSDLARRVWGLGKVDEPKDRDVAAG